MRDEAIASLALDGDERVLDVGCGTGFATEALIEAAGEVHGLDQSVHQLEQAWAKLGKHEPVRYVRGDAERLPYADDSFDVVWSSGSIEYWPNPVDALEELRRVTRPGGQVLVVGPDDPTNTVFKKVADAIMLFYDAEEADRMFRAAGLREADHTVMQAKPGSPRAIVSRADVPE